LLVVTIRAQPVNIVVIQVYMPTSDYPEEQIETMYDLIEGIVEKQKANDYVVVMGDWNAVVGDGKQGTCIGEFGLGTQNEAGEILMEFAKRHDMLISNTMFKHDKRRLYTWKAPGKDGQRYQLDYIMVRQRYKNSVKNAHTYPGADAETDHNLLVMKMKMKLKFVRRK
jgi:exonuclease III